MGTQISYLLPNIKMSSNRPIVVRESYSETLGALPESIVELVDNKAFLPRHKRLQREHGDKVLLKLAELAATKGKPSHWYATVTSLANWERTLEMVKKLIASARRAIDVMEKVGADQSWRHWYIKAVSRLSEAQVAGFVERSIGAKSPPRLFVHLCKEALA